MPVKKVVFVSTVSPFPVDNGKRAVVQGILKYLIERYGAEQVTFVLLGRTDNGNASPPNFPCKFLSPDKPGVLRRLLNVFWFALLKREKSIQEMMVYSAGFGRRLRTIVDEIGPNLVVCDTFRAGQVFETPGRAKGRYILYMDDLFSVRYRNMLEVLERFPQARLNPLGNFIGFVPRLLRPLAGMTFMQTRLLRLEQGLVEKREQECVRWFDENLLINGHEADLLRRRTGHPAIRPIKPLLTDAGNGAERRYAGNPVFVFLGALNVPHNGFSITRFIETQMDKLVEEIPGVRLRIIGRGASDELLRLVAEYKGIVSVEGFVENLDAVFDESCAMLVPLLFGSGVKIKTLEALSRGLPVISTDFGVEGIPVTNAVNCVVENDLDRYPRVMAQVTDAGHNARISRKAREFYLENYSREQVFREYSLLFG